LCEEAYAHDRVTGHDLCDIDPESGTLSGLVNDYKNTRETSTQSDYLESMKYATKKRRQDITK